MRVNPSGNPGMATGGTGDVLSGMVGALLAQGLPPRRQRRIGVLAHGLAGRRRGPPQGVSWGSSLPDLITALGMVRTRWSR